MNQSDRNLKLRTSALSFVASILFVMIGLIFKFYGVFFLCLLLAIDVIRNSQPKDYYTDLTVKRSIEIISKYLGIFIVGYILLGFTLVALSSQMDSNKFFQLLYSAYNIVDVGRIEKIMVLYDDNGMEYKSVFISSVYGVLTIFFVLFVIISWPVLRKQAIIILHRYVSNPAKNTKPLCYIIILLFLGSLLVFLKDLYYFNLTIDSFEEKNNLGRYLRTDSVFPFIQSEIMLFSIYLLATPAVVSIQMLSKLNKREG